MNGCPKIEGFVFKQRLLEALYCTLWRAEQVALEREVFVAVFHPEVIAAKERFQLCLRNVQRLVEIRCRIFPDVIDIFEREDSTCVVLEESNAQNIVTLLSGRRLDVNQAISLLKGIVESFSELEREGVFYGGMQPTALFLTGDSQPFLPDITMVQFLSGQSAHLPIEISESMAPYVAPEVYTQGSRVECRADMFATAMTLYALITGQVPFGALSANEILQAKLTQGIPSPCDIVKKFPRGLAMILMRMAQRNPAHRYPDWDAVAFDLHQLSVGVELSGGETGGSVILPPSSRSVKIVRGAVHRKSTPRRKEFTCKMCFLVGLHWLLLILVAGIFGALVAFFIIQAR